MTLTFLNFSQLRKKYAITPKQSLGQNFLVDPAALERVLDAGNLSAGEHVLEIGAGLGSLTVLLAQTAGSVCAVEIDRRFQAPLEEVLAPYANVNLVWGDILELDVDALSPQGGYCVVANIPYYISSAIIRRLLSAKKKPTRIILTVQKEVASRIVASDGKMSLLALSVQVFGRPDLCAVLPRGCFFPEPNVDSAVLRIELFAEPVIALEELDDFFSLAHAGFAQKRKTLRNSLSALDGMGAQKAEELLSQAGLEPSRRAETLNLTEWVSLTRLYRQLF